MNHFFVLFGKNFVLGNSSAAAQAPGHHIPALVKHLFLAAFFEKMPDGVIIRVGHRVIRIVPVHPLAETD